MTKTFGWSYANWLNGIYARLNIGISLSAYLKAGRKLRLLMKRAPELYHFNTENRSKFSNDLNESVLEFHLVYKSCIYTHREIGENKRENKYFSVTCYLCRNSCFINKLVWPWIIHSDRSIISGCNLNYQTRCNMLLHTLWLRAFELWIYKNDFLLRIPFLIIKTQK